jgi:hypothetical protein
MGRRSYGNVDCLRIYPVEGSLKQLADLKTVAFILSKEQAVELASNLLNAARKSNQIDVTGFRARNLISVTTPPSELRAPSTKKRRRLTGMDA